MNLSRGDYETIKKKKRNLAKRLSGGGGEEWER